MARLSISARRGDLAAYEAIHAADRPIGVQTVELGDGITGGDGAGFEDAVVPAGAAVADHGLWHARVGEAQSEFEAGFARLGDLQGRGADADDVADADLFFQGGVDGQVFGQCAPVPEGGVLGVAFAPDGVGGGAIAVDGFCRVAMDAEIGLFVAG